MTKHTKGPLSRECPKCHQPPGKHCNTPTGKSAGRHHSARLNPQQPTPPGRPPLLTPELMGALTTMLSVGTTITTAAAATKLHPSTIYEWIARGNSDADEDREFREFREAVTQARAIGNAEMARHVYEAGLPKVREIPVLNPVTGNQATNTEGEPLFKYEESHDWRAHSWVLERAYAGEWGRRQTLEITGDPELAGLPDRGGASELANRIASRLMEVAEAQRTGGTAAITAGEQTVSGEVES